MKQGGSQGVKEEGPSAGEGRHGVGGGPFLRVPATPTEAGESGPLCTEGGRRHGASQSCSGGGSIRTVRCAVGGSARRPRGAGVADGLGARGGWCSHHAIAPSASGVTRMPARVAYMPSGPGSSSRTPSGHAAAGSPACSRRRTRISGSSDSGTSGQVPEASRPASWPTSHARPAITTTVPMATSSRVSLACWCWSCAQARHRHSGRSGRIPTTPLRGVLGEEGVVAGLGTAGDLPQGALPVAAGDRGATAPAGPTAAGGRAGAVREVLSRLDGPAGRAASVAGWLERRTGVARLVRHHEVPFFAAVEGFARGAGPGGVGALPGPTLIGAGSGGPRRCQVRIGSYVFVLHVTACGNELIACIELLVVDELVYDAYVGH